MKKVVSLLLMILILVSFVPAVSAAENLWEAEYRKVIGENRISRGKLLDINGDTVPELVLSVSGKVQLYHIKEATYVKSYEGTEIPFEFFNNLKLMTAAQKNDTGFFGQAIYKGILYTYRMNFENFVPALDVIAQENIKTGVGSVKLDNEVFSQSYTVTGEVAEYFEDYAESYMLCADILPEEIKMFGTAAGLTRAFGRYNLFTEISDNQVSFSAAQREKIKKNAGQGKFLEFHRISVLSDDFIFVEFFTNDTQNEKVILPYDKNYALLDSEMNVIESYRDEKDVATSKISSLIAVEKAPSNINPDYKKCASFRGIDDYVNYLSQIIPSGGAVNDNDKKELAQFLEYAVNKCSRAEIKAKNNTLTINKKSVSIVAESAGISMGQLLSVCKSKKISQIRTARTIPELVCTGVDFSRPVRIEFADNTAKALANATGIRIMLSDTHGIYLNTAELAILEENTDTFCIEYTLRDEDYSIVFTDGHSSVIDQIYSPVWFIVPAKYEYSSVLVSYDGGTGNRGGQFDKKTSTIEFSAVRSGNYQLVEDDITINDTDSLPMSKSEAIRFLVSKGILDLDRKNNFYPEKIMTLDEFDEAVSKMFYNEQYDGISKKLRLTKEYMLATCGKILVQKKGYQCPENYMDYILFSDKSGITPENAPYIAVAVQCGLCENGGDFLPDTFIAKSDAAEVLYKTYMLLYEASSVTTSLSAAAQKADGWQEPPSDLSGLVRVGLCIIITAGLFAGVYIIEKTRKKKE